VNKILLAGLFLLGLSCNILAQDAKPSKPSELEKNALLDARKIEGEAVIAFNEALLTAQSCRRAQAYLSVWDGAKGLQYESGIPADLQDINGKLQALEERFSTLWQAHFDETERVRPGEKATARSDEAKRLADDAEARTSARESLLNDYREIRARAREALQKYSNALRELQGKAASAGYIPSMTPTPRFSVKPSATLQPNGTATGIMLGDSACSPDLPLWQKLLGLDTLSGIYAPSVAWRPSDQLEPAASCGLTVQLIVPAAVHMSMYCQADWYNKCRAEGLEINLPGAPEQYKGSWLWPLDFYHPAVREMFAQYLKGVGKQFRDDRRILMYTTAWEPEFEESHAGQWGKWPTGGRTPAGVQAFREYLRKKFDTIEKLNEAWQSHYAKFEAIEPPPDVYHGPEPGRGELVANLFAGTCPPLYYEFHRFLKDSYAEYLAWTYRLLKEADPTHPVSLSPSYGAMDGYLCMGRDSFLWAAEACDLYGSEDASSLEEVFGWSISRSRGRNRVITECVWNGPENWTFPTEEILRAVTRRNLWRMVAWGRVYIAIFGSIDTYGGAADNNYLVFESGYNLLRRCGGVIAPLKNKLRSMEDVWLNAPVVAPRIAMLKPSTAQICAWPDDAVRGISGNLHSLLYRRNYHYAFVPEEDLLSGHDSLERYSVLILPYATHFPPGLSEKIIPWVKSGGTLISAGIAGGFTRYGAKDGSLMKELFGDIGYQNWSGVTGELYWELNAAKLRPEVQDVGPNDAGSFESVATLLFTRYGAGQALLAADANYLRPGGSAAPLFYELLDRAAPRAAWAEGAELEMNLRQSGNVLHVTLINPDLKAAVKATIRLAARYQKAVDRGVEGGFPVPLREKEAGQAFDIWLAPGEGTMVDLFSAQK
jgi:hypothetical protein